MIGRLFLTGLMVCLSACAKSTDDLKQEYINELLMSVQKQVILPAYGRFATAADNFKQDTIRYCSQDKRADLRALQESWRAAMTAWQETAAYAFGPITLYDLSALVNYPTIRKSKIDYWLEPGGRRATAETIKTYSVQGKGLGTLEYLLFDETIERNPEHCAYLSALADDLQASADRILRLWQTDPLPLSAAGTDATQMQRQQLLDEFLNAALHAMEMVKDDKLGIPLGKKHDGAIQPDAVESRRSGHSLQNIRANVISLQNTFYGGIIREPQQFGLKTYLHKTGKQAVAEALEQNLQQLVLELERIPDPLQTAIREQPATVETAYRSLAALCNMLETDVLPAFDVQPGFNAKDGD
jgi:predicted lipoprotein